MLQQGLDRLSRRRYERRSAGVELQGVHCSGSLASANGPTRGHSPQHEPVEAVYLDYTDGLDTYGVQLDTFINQCGNVCSIPSILHRCL